MLKKVKRREDDAHILIDGYYYGLPLSEIRKRSIQVNNFCGESEEIDISTESDTYYAKKALERQKKAILLAEQYKPYCEVPTDYMNFEILSSELNLPEDIILCKYDEKTNTLVEPLSNVAIKVLGQNDKEFSEYANSREYPIFELEYYRSLKYPLMTFDIYDDSILYEYSDELKKQIKNDKYTEKLQILRDISKLNLMKQFNKMVEIEHLIANEENKEYELKN